MKLMSMCFCEGIIPQPDILPIAGVGCLVTNFVNYEIVSGF